MKKIICLLLAVFSLGLMSNVVSATTIPVPDEHVTGEHLKTFTVKNSPKKNGEGKLSVKLERKEGESMSVYLDCYDGYVVVGKNKKSSQCEETILVSKKKSTLQFYYKNLTGRDIVMYISVAVSNKDGGVEESVNKAVTIPAAGVATTPSLYEISKSDHVRGGNKDSKVVVITYSDLECPYCALFNETTKELEENYGNKVAFVYRHFPLTEIHRSALPAARASECVAASKGNAAFFAFIDELYSEQRGSFDFETFETAAKNVGVKSSDFNKCMDGSNYIDLVAQQREDAISTGGQGTPHSIIIGKNGKKEVIQGAQPYPVMKDLIDSYLK